MTNTQLIFICIVITIYALNAWGWWRIYKIDGGMNAETYK